MVSGVLIGFVVGLRICGIARAKNIQDYHQEGIKAYRAAHYGEAISAWKGG